MNTELMERLLNEEESSELDFKRDQYPFYGATNEQKGELLKDILAFANAWRRADAYILVGVEEVRGGRSDVVGVASHLNDNDLQQFVNTKTNRPVAFSYEAFPFEGSQVGVIRVELQERPVYLNRDFGRLRANVVYVRRGSSADEAKPDEVARMGSAAAVAAGGELPRLILTAHGQRQARRIVLSLRNEGRGSARAPYLSLRVPQSYRLWEYGIDGNFGPGFLGTPHGVDAQRRPQFGGNAGQVIHSNSERDVCILEFDGHDADSRPGGRLVIEYEAAAEGLEATPSSLTVNLDELRRAG